jgi:hypothetical protein
MDFQDYEEDDEQVNDIIDDVIEDDEQVLDQIVRWRDKARRTNW